MFVQYGFYYFSTRMCFVYSYFLCAVAGAESVRWQCGQIFRDAAGRRAARPDHHVPNRVLRGIVPTDSGPSRRRLIPSSFLLIRLVALSSLFLLNIYLSFSVPFIHFSLLTALYSAMYCILQMILISILFNRVIFSFK